jgi:uncharacterized protein (DUF58 family)
MLPFSAARRGIARCGRLEIFTRYPIGLFHAWSYVDFKLHVTVYPKPDPLAGTPPAQSRSASEEGIPIAGDEEFNMLRVYRAGDAPKLIAWKALAREQGLADGIGCLRGCRVGQVPPCTGGLTLGQEHPIGRRHGPALE